AMRPMLSDRAPIHVALPAEGCRSRAVIGEGDAAPTSRDGARRAIGILVVAGIVALAARLALVAILPDADTDAYGHFKIGRALVPNPADLSVHWVWLPGYHYAVWAMIHLGAGFTAVRAVNAVIQAAGPLLLFDLVARRGGEDPARSRAIALVSALAW